ncbi:MAG TPA: enoyl-CoA hydratase/isomerase family protein [Rhizomicrobium sp.]|nr:enoyl-CoA hydratase/isomerase family protein [Rhizomicrobium sp.]
MQEAEPEILFETRGALGLITLNRPKALNSLTHGMCIGMHKALREWEKDDAVRAVAIRGLGSRAFCAGGDIRAMAHSSIDKTSAAAEFLRDEYRVNALIGAFSKPYIALTHGIVMGGGAGVSVHGQIRLADTDLVFAMPETGIGFVPDIGASYFLSRCPGQTGMYLGLTGARIGLGDALALGLMTHSVAASDHEVIIRRLAEGDAPEKAVAAVVRASPPPPMREHRALIDLAFAAQSVESVLERLDRDGGIFATETARVIRSRSPTSLKLAFELVRRGKELPLSECLNMEYRAGVRTVMGHDFREGVRALLRDKDGRPRWRPSTLAAVTDEETKGYFSPLGAFELGIRDNADG